MAWTINYSDTAVKQLRSMEKPVARRILDFMDQQVANQQNPRRRGHALSGPVPGVFWHYRVAGYRVTCDILAGALSVLVVEIGFQRNVHRRGEIGVD